MLILKALLAIILTEATTEILVKSELFRPVRQYLFEKGKPALTYLHDLLDCGHCTSVWVGWFMALILLGDINVVHWSIDWLFLGLAVHRLSNVWHFAIDKLGYIKE